MEDRLTPIYPSTEGLHQARMRKLVGQCVPLLDEGNPNSITDFVPEGTEAITPAQWAIIGTLGVLLLLTLALFFFVSRSTREPEEKEHQLLGTLGKVATAIESMAPEEEAEEEELDLPDEETDAGDDEEKIDYFGFIRKMPQRVRDDLLQGMEPVSYTHLKLPTNREV